ncbi:DNA-binding transcriptional MerR regulator [Oikeobacillus pervagus]|uniref:DNA-binding transcriptional MerR regulator n=1 Tax=Oikeobacillus pervagus TaxID=1325931 RepID=A0AAJ1SYL4_9BACI|nr:helix-turn-helix domain-containing protein [Oikeobacillus pervagus]MDQ0214919.1 DNA-binding transcriptional MerR regulator [Oikeobacillus pervagus]
MSKQWNLDEIEYLEENIGFYKVSTIAEKMGRTYESVRIKMNRLGIANTKQQTGLVTIGELANILKVERNTVKWWTQKHGLPYRKKITKKSKIFYFIDPTKFWTWAEKNKSKIQFLNIEPQSLPPEPDWVAEERRNEREKKVRKKRVYQQWTTKEDQTLLELRNEGLTYAEIGEIMDRSVNSIVRRYKRII